MRLPTLVFLSALFAPACGDSDPAVDAGPSIDSGADSSAADAVSADAGNDAGAVDAGGADAGPGPDGGPDLDAGPDAGPGNYVAVAGARCTPQSRIGVVSLTASGVGHYLFGTLSDSPRPFVGEAEETTDACSFHQANRAACDCEGELVCTHDRERCVPAPERVDLGVEVHAGDETLVATVMNDGSGPVVSESIALEGESFGMTVTGLGATITLEATVVPPRIEVEDVLRGTYDAPEGVDLTWTPEESDVVVYSLTNINHHVPEPTFTECGASASEGSLTIPGSMLVPLSVSTGLEFQRVESIRFAAAELPEGCVEFRYSTQ